MEKDISIGAIVFRKGTKIEFLIVKRRDNDIWEFPKGYMNCEEKELDTLKRELYEELGFSNYTLIPNFREVISYISSSRNVERVMIFYLVTSANSLKVSDEHSEFKWVTTDETGNYLPFEDVIRILKKVENLVE